MTEQQKLMLKQALESLDTAWSGKKKKWYISANEYATAKIEDVLALEDEDIKTTEKIYIDTRNCSGWADPVRSVPTVFSSIRQY